MRILISACLLGARCRYDGVSKLQPWISDLAERHILVPVCPEQLGGLPTPRPPAEILDGKVINAESADVTQQYEKGAREILKLARLFNCEAAILKERSPACGFGKVHNGLFDGGLVEGNGVLAGLLSREGLTIIGETQTDRLTRL